jgi:hypothetical protein
VGEQAILDAPAQDFLMREAPIHSSTPTKTAQLCQTDALLSK